MIGILFFSSGHCFVDQLKVWASDGMPKPVWSSGEKYVFLCGRDCSECWLRHLKRCRSNGLSGCDEYLYDQLPFSREDQRPRLAPSSAVIDKAVGVSHEELAHIAHFKTFAIGVCETQLKRCHIEEQLSILKRWSTQS